jgi:hypothetical protein
MGGSPNNRHDDQDGHAKQRAPGYAGHGAVSGRWNRRGKKVSERSISSSSFRNSLSTFSHIVAVMAALTPAPQIIVDAVLRLVV